LNISFPSLAISTIEFNSHSSALPTNDHTPIDFVRHDVDTTGVATLDASLGKFAFSIRSIAWMRFQWSAKAAKPSNLK
jgi:hypothetical protein